MANNNEKFISRENAKTLWGYMVDLLTGKYTKPSGGIPKSDLESSVQTSLGLADSALQSETDPTVPSWAKATNKPSYTQDEVGDGTTYKRVSQTEKDTWNGKQNALSTAQMNAVNSGITAEEVAQISTNQSSLVGIIANCGKNKILSIAKSATIGEAVFTVNSDKSVSLYTTATTSATRVFHLLIAGDDIEVNATDIVSGVPNFNEKIAIGWGVGDSGNTDTIKGNDPTPKPVGYSGKIRYFSIVVEANVSISSSSPITFYPMICSVEDWNISSDYVPGVPNNKLLTSTLARQIDNGVKNVLEITNTPSVGSVFAVANGEITINGSTTADTYFSLFPSYVPNIYKGLVITSDFDYSDDRFDVYIVYSNNGSSQAGSTQYLGGRVEPISSSYEYIQILIKLKANKSASNVKFKPMICNTEDLRISDEIVTHALGNQYLTPALIEQIDKGAKNLVDWRNTTPVGTDVTISDGTYTSNNSDSRTTLRFQVYAVDSNYATLAFFNGNGTEPTSNGVINIPFTLPSGTAEIRAGHNGGQKNARFIIPISTLKAGKSYVMQVNVTQYTNPNGIFAWKDLMICTLADWNVSHKFVPYRPSWDIVYDKIPTAKYKRYACTAANTYEKVSELSFTVDAYSTRFISIRQDYGNAQPKGIAVCVSGVTPSSYSVLLSEDANIQCASGIIINHGSTAKTYDVYVSQATANTNGNDIVVYRSANYAI